MNYFELFGIPVSLTIDKKPLVRTYFELQKAHHPDYFGQESEEAQEAALALSAQVNLAWKTFDNRDATVKYVLQEKGLLQEEEKYQLAPEFLMEVMDLNEMKMDGADPATIGEAVKKLDEHITEDVLEILNGYDENIHTEKDLLRVKEWYYRKKYLERLLAE